MKLTYPHQIRNIVSIVVFSYLYITPALTQTPTNFGLKSQRMLAYNVNDSVIISFTLKTYLKGLDREQRSIFLKDSLHTADTKDTIVLSYLYGKQLMRMLKRHQAKLYSYEVSAESLILYSVKQRESQFCKKSVVVLEAQTQKSLFGYCFGRKEPRNY